MSYFLPDFYLLHMYLFLIYYYLLMQRYQFPYIQLTNTMLIIFIKKNKRVSVLNFFFNLRYFVGIKRKKISFKLIILYKHKNIFLTFFKIWIK